MRSLPFALLVPLLAWSVARGATPKPAQDRAQIAQAIKEVLERPPFSVARAAVEVVSLETGEVVFAQNADELLNPASNVKLFTSAAALAKLGPEYRYETELYTDAPLKNGKARILYVRGKGDPTFTTERMYELCSELLHNGLREVSDLVLDESWFDTERIAPGYDQEDSDRAYMAPTGALSLNWNTVGVYMRPGAAPGAKAVVEMDPPSDYFDVQSFLTTSSRNRRRFNVSSDPSKTAKDKQRIIVRGMVPVGGGTWSVWKKIDNPPMYFGQTLKAMLKSRGVKVTGRVRIATVPPDAKLLYVAQSDTLDLVLKRMNKVSSNFIAEQLIKTMAAELKGPPGTTAKGVEVVEDFLDKDVGVPRGAYVMKNGSGLNDTNRFSAAQLAKLLTHMVRRFPLMPEYLSSLGIAGKDGTLRYRFEGTDAVGKLRAKTGTLEHVSALSGYVVGQGGERFAFSMMVNDYPGRAGPVIRGLDAMGAAVAASGTVGGPSRAVASVIDGEKPQATFEALAARVRTYLALGKQSDKRNIAFLRTAWRSEKDPAVRAVLAESLYQSDPQDYMGMRTLLDSFSASPEVYGRLRQVAKSLGVETPGLSAMVDLAAEGNQEAMARVLELCRASAPDSDTQKTLVEGLSEVARSAPAELLSALRQAAPQEREAATALLALGLLAITENDHPFWKALHQSTTNPDSQVATFAKDLEANLTQRIAKAKAPAEVPQPTPANAVVPAGTPQKSPSPVAHPGG